MFVCNYQTTLIKFQLMKHVFFLFLNIFHGCCPLLFGVFFPFKNNTESGKNVFKHATKFIHRHLFMIRNVLHKTFYWFILCTKKLENDKIMSFRACFTLQSKKT